MSGGLTENVAKNNIIRQRIENLRAKIRYCVEALDSEYRSLLFEDTKVSPQRFNEIGQALCEVGQQVKELK